MTYFDKIMDGTATMKEFEDQCTQWESSALLSKRPCSVYLGVSREVFYALVTTHDEKQFNETLEVIRDVYEKHGKESA